MSYSGSSSKSRGGGFSESKYVGMDDDEQEFVTRPKNKPMTTLVSEDFERETLAVLGEVEEVSTHYRDLLRGAGSEEEAGWYAGLQGRSGQVVSIETAAMRRTRDFLLILADEMAKKRGRRIYRRAFVGWRVHVFRYIFLRDQMVHTYLIHTYLARRFHAWRLVARRQSALDVCLRQCWRRRRLHRFQWWKHGARWQALKLRLTLRVVRHLKGNVTFQFAVRRRWRAMGRFLYRRWAARVIQRVQRRHALRRVAWARRTIKYFLLRCRGYRLLKRRRREELRRAAYEQETSDILVRRALENLDGLLNDDGSVILSQYLKSVNGVVKQIELAAPGSLLAQAKLFPALKEAPDFARLWTVRAKAMAVLRLRCTAEVHRLARRRFRQSSPPVYECARCAKTFLLKVERFNHLKYGCTLRPIDVDVDEDDDDDEDADDSEEAAELHRRAARKAATKRRYAQRQHSRYKGYVVPDDSVDELERDYICWRLAQPIVEAALQPLASYLTKQKAHPGGAGYVLPKAKGGGIF